MKTLYFYLLFALLFSLQGQEQWTWLNPLPQGNQLNEVFAISPDTAIAVGATGTIIRTEDGGQNWQVISSGTILDLNAVFFASSDIGFAVGDDGIVLKTTDSGNSWDISFTGRTSDLFAVYCVTESVAYISGAFGDIYKTVDSGGLWFILTSGTPYSLYSIFFIDEHTGYAVGRSGTTVSTTDGGQSWISAPPQVSKTLNSVFFVDADTGYVAGDDLSFLKTMDGGNSWNLLNVGSSSSPDYSDLYFTDLTTGFRLNGKFIEKTINGGNDWQSYASGVDDLLAIHFSGPDAGYTVGESGAIFKTVDAGNSWEIQREGTTWFINGATFVDDTTMYFAGSGGNILASDNGGTTFDTLSVPTASTLYDISSTGRDTLIVVGTGGSIFLSPNKGINWSPRTSGTSSSLYTVFHTNASIVYAGGSSGKILKSIDGGLSWAILNSGTTSSIYGLYFLTDEIGFAAGSSGTVLKTINGGINWGSKISGASYTLYSILFLDTNTGFCIGSSGRFLETIDGGESWIVKNIGTFEFLNSIHIRNSGIGYISGDNGTIFQTNDFGGSWSLIESKYIPTEYDFDIAYTTESGIAYVAGDYGAVLFNGNNQLPIITNLNATPTSGIAPLTVSFNCNAFDPDGIITEYRWDYENDGTPDEINTTGMGNFTYTAAGEYQAKCTVVDSGGAIAATTVTINVAEASSRQVVLASAAAAPGSTVQVLADISDAAGVAGASATITFNENILTAVGVTTTPLTNGFLLADTISPGKISLSLANATGIPSGTGPFLALNFQVNPAALDGDTTSLHFESLALFAENLDTIPVTVQHGLFTVDDNITPADTVEIFISPARDTLLSISGTAPFRAYGIENDGDTVNVSVDWLWEDNIGMAGSIGPGSGQSTIFSAAAPGDGRLIATLAALADTAIMLVGESKGDVDLSGQVKVPDAILALRIIPGLFSPSPYQHWAADFDNNTMVNAGDALSILQASLGDASGDPGTGNAIVSIGEPRPLGNGAYEIAIFAANRPDISGMDLAFRYNARQFTLTQTIHKPGALLAENLNAPDSLARLSVIGRNGILFGNRLLLALRLSPAGQSGVLPVLTISDILLFDAEGEEISVQQGPVGIVADPAGAIPSDYSLAPNYPNPFNPSTTIAFGLPEAGAATLRIYDIRSRVIRKLLEQKQLSPGVYQAVWDGRDSYGEAAASGIYFYQLRIEGKWQETRKMILMK